MSTAYIEWFEGHEPVCQITHDGSAQAMETAGAVIMFGRSFRKHNLRYNPYVSDGDSKAYSAVCEAAPYGNAYFIQKEECVGHIQKRMGARLRKLVTSYKGM